MRASMNPSLLTAVAAAAAALALVACDRYQQDASSGTGSDTPVAQGERPAERPTEPSAPPMAATPQAQMDSAPPAAGNPSNDAAITASVKAALSRDPELSAHKVEVDTADGKVTLRGTVPSPQARGRAVDIASAVQGVRAIDDRLEVTS